MRRAALLFSLSISVMSAADLPKEGLAELYADNFKTVGDTVIATGHVVLSYGENLFIGKTARYDREKNVIVVEGNVEVLSNRGNKVLADRVRFDVGKKRLAFKDFYETDREDIWIYAQEAEKAEGNYTLRNSVLSSCQPENPDWSVKFDEADYNATKKYMELHGVKFYAGTTPVLYTPYLGFSLDRQRSSGLLMPHLGMKQDEGFIYDQPYFWAISPSKDLQLDPQMRTKRGAGLYATFRFADGPDSGGKLRLGYFYDRKSFRDRYELENASHYGLEFLYHSDSFLGAYRPEGYREGLYADLDLFNDIDYHNLQYEGLTHLDEASSRYRESRFNYFLYDDRNYFGVGARYFIDTQSLENNETVQELPTLQYHRSYTPLFDDMIDYSVDARFHNYTRQDGPTAQRGSVTLPLLFHTALLDDYLSLSVEEAFSAADTHFSERSIWSSSSAAKENHYAAVTLGHTVELSSDLIRAYASGLHTLLLKAAFTKTSILAEGDLKYEEIDDSLKQTFDLEQVYDARLAFSMHNFWRSTESDFAADYLVLADYYPDNDSKWNLLRQELHLNYGRIEFSSRVDYSLQHNSLAQLTNSLKYDGERFGFSLEHTRLTAMDFQDLDENEIGFKARYRQSETFSWYGGYTYDLRADSTKEWQAGFTLDRKCWNFTLLFERNTTPVLQRGGGGSIRNNAIYFRFNLLPFGGVGSAGKMTI